MQKMLNNILMLLFLMSSLVYILWISIFISLMVIMLFMTQGFVSFKFLDFLCPKITSNSSSTGHVNIISVYFDATTCQLNWQNGKIILIVNCSGKDSVAWGPCIIWLRWTWHQWSWSQVVVTGHGSNVSWCQIMNWSANNTLVRSHNKLKYYLPTQGK